MQHKFRALCGSRPGAQRLGAIENGNLIPQTLYARARISFAEARLHTQYPRAERAAVYTPKRIYEQRVGQRMILIWRYPDVRLVFNSQDKRHMVHTHTRE